MNPVGTTGPKHFKPEEEAALHNDTATSDIVRRDTKVDIRGVDATRREVKEHQQSVGDNAKALAASLAIKGVDCVEMLELVHHGGIAGASMLFLGGVVAPLGTLFVGGYELYEAHEKADAQAAAIVRDNAHVALVATLDLPTAYKTKRLEGDYAEVAKGPQSPAFRMAEAINADPKGRLQLQLHADRGMSAARDAARSGLPVDAFLKANPKIAEAYARDAAFHEGFDAYVHTRQTSPAAAKALDTKLDERDGWYAQSSVAIRV